jgi:hypothetical protein
MNPPPKPKALRWFYIVAGVGCALLIAFCLVEQARGAWKLHQRRSSLRAEGQPLSISASVSVPQSNGPFIAWESLTLSLPTNRMSVGVVSGSLMKLIQSGQALALWNDPEWMASNQVANAISESRAALENVHEALAANPAPFPLSYEQGDNALIPHLRHVQLLQEWLACQSLDHMSQGNHGGVLNCIESMGRLAGCLENDLFLVCQAWRIRILSVRSRLAWAALEMDGWSDAQLERLQALLELRIFAAGFAKMLQVERAIWDQNFFRMAIMRFNDQPLDHLLEGEPEQMLHWIGFRAAWWRQDKWRSLVMYDHLIEAHQIGFASNSLHSAEAHFWKVEEPGCIGIESWYDAMRYRTAHIVQHGAFNQLRITLNRLYEAETLRALVSASVGIRRYRLRNQEQLPENLTDVWKALGMEGQQDALSGEPLRYLKGTDRDGWIVYSTGKDAIDHGGDQTDRWGRAPDGQYRTSIWSSKDAVLPGVATVQQVRSWQQTIAKKTIN